MQLDEWGGREKSTMCRRYNLCGGGKPLMKNWKHILFQLTIVTLIVSLVGYSWYLNKQLSQLNANNTVLNQVVITLLFPTREIPTQEIPTVTPQYTCSYPLATDWNLYRIKSLDAIYHGEYGDELYDPYESPLPRNKAYVTFLGRKYLGEKPVRNIFGNTIFVFSQNGKNYNFSVNNRIESDLALLDKGMEITIFTDRLWHASKDNPFIGDYEHIVQDYAVGETIAQAPDFHWNVAIVQNGDLFTGNDVYIKKQPFTINTYLPRSKDVKASVKVNVSSNPQTQLFIGFNLKEKCATESAFAPKYPFCAGHSAFEYANNGGRDLFVSEWLNHTFWYKDCFQSALNKVDFSENTGIFERDVLYLRISENNSDGVYADRVTTPVSVFTGDKLFLTFFYDINENEIIDANEMKTRILHLE
jgi:hypothetical protein